jgi:hypothetical protein
MGLVIAAKDHIMFRIGEAEYVVISILVSRIDPMYERGFVGLLCLRPRERGQRNGECS